MLNLFSYVQVCFRGVAVTALTVCMTCGLNLLFLFFSCTIAVQGPRCTLSQVIPNAQLALAASLRA